MSVGKTHLPGRPLQCDDIDVAHQNILDVKYAYDVSGHMRTDRLFRFYGSGAASARTAHMGMRITQVLGEFMDKLHVGGKPSDVTHFAWHA